MKAQIGISLRMKISLNPSDRSGREKKNSRWPNIDTNNSNREHA